MLIKNIFIENSKTASDIRIEDGIFKTISSSLEALPGEEVIDCTGKSAFPPFIESHVHLDTCLTAGDPVWNMSGTLFEGIECWSKRKEKLSKEDVKDRARRAIKMQASNGIQHVRTHVDVTDPTLIAMEGMLELKDELKDFVNIQIVAFPQEGILSYPNGKQLLENAVKMGADCVGAIPHFEFTREYAVESVNFCMELAEKYGRLVDVHCDEIDDEQSKGLEVLACRALESGMKDMVTASHTTAMHSYNNAYCSKLFRLLGMSDINFVCNPLVNTHLQGRFDTYPKRRGVTRVKELLANGNNVSMGHDDIFDPWYPLGDGNMMTVVHMGLHVCQMMGYEEILNSYKLITHNAARTLHLGNSYGIKEGNPASFIVLNNDNFYNALNKQSEVLYSFNRGRLIASAVPAVKKILF
ncbi:MULTISPECIES: cytosine deaminase [Fusobacterium]|jgi:cytosine deaminase|uniref:Cytosine deaminase n=1 Tax=Fusobacterium varium ATCC 27725 TaxID=469618 RepID=A0ABM6U646_FUSVA|nr:MULTISPECIES: cytosine deaminase [Fusobacterium]AVQ31857.1 cytosine deaminase [Fusobacterium varium ATCC 27725]EES63212.1 cytosine deaminase [Fusobacterium varium ATCC 27725]MCF0171484.1 cytosine deaminase [Fusobacterium varium]MCF2672354.1 cytosine deaminase [Fusobacterium varium]MCI6032515.1 cytosine deaminase [Fusobacterium varium]